MWVLIIVVLTFGVTSCNGSNEATEPSTPPKTSVVSGYLRDKTNDRVIVFVHGVLGDARATWTAANGAYWPALLLGDETFKDFDIYVYDYPSPLFAVSYSIDELADNLRLLLDSASVFDLHREVLFVCHSMGGLIVRAFLLKYQQFAPKVQMIYFLSTPTTGSELAALAHSVARQNPQYDDMKLWKDNAYVGNLVRQWQAAQFRIKSYCAYEKRQTYGVKIVGEQSATNLCNQRLDPIDTDHTGIAKPSDRSAVPYLAFRQAVLETPPTPAASPPAPPVLIPVYQKQWVRTDERGRPYFELFRVRTENRHFRPDIVAKRTETLAHPTGRIYEVQYECTGYPCGWSYNPDGGYGIKYQVDSDSRHFTWYRKWDGAPCDETYKALYEVQTEVCVKNCPQ